MTRIRFRRASRVVGAPKVEQPAVGYEVAVGEVSKLQSSRQILMNFCNCFNPIAGFEFNLILVITATKLFPLIWFHLLPYRYLCVCVCHSKIEHNQPNVEPSEPLECELKIAILVGREKRARGFSVQVELSLVCIWRSCCHSGNRSSYEKMDTRESFFDCFSSCRA